MNNSNMAHSIAILSNNFENATIAPSGFGDAVDVILSDDTELQFKADPVVDCLNGFDRYGNVATVIQCH